MKANNKQTRRTANGQSASNNTKKESSLKGMIPAGKFKLWPAVMGALALAAIFITLITYENEYLFRVQELNLFLYTPLYFKQCMVVAGGMLTYLGCFFTQFFYHQWLGAAMLCAWWALLMWVIKRTFGISNKSAVILFYPVALLLLTDFFLGYWIFYLKMCGHFFASTIGFTSTVALIWAFRSLPSRNYLRSIFIVISTALLYPLIGFYSLLATLCMGVIDWKLADEKR